MLPIFPLDGGQIFRALLWFFLGAARSLQVAAIVGLVGAAAGAVLAIALLNSIWIGCIAAFAALYSWQSLKSANLQLALQRAGVTPEQYAASVDRGFAVVDRTPRYTEYACPACRTSPAVSTDWECESCGRPVDPFATPSHQCPHCGMVDQTTTCPACLRPTPTALWHRPGIAPPPLPLPILFGNPGAASENL